MPTRPWLLSPTVPPMDLGDSSHGRVGILAKRAANVRMRYHTHYQGEVNIAFAAFVRQRQGELEAQAVSNRDHVASLQAQITATQRELEAARASASKDIARIDGYFAARPYMAIEAYGSSRELTKPMGYGYDRRELPGKPDFADLF